MSEPLRKRYAIRISAKGEERLLSKMPLYGFERLKTLDSVLWLFAQFNTSIEERENEKIMFFDAEPGVAPTIIREFYFFSDGLAEQVQLADEEIVAWKDPDKTYLIRFDETAIERFARKVSLKIKRKITHEICPAGYAVGKYFEVFAITVDWDNENALDYCRVFVNHEDAAQVIEELSEICEDHIKVLESGETIDYNNRIEKEGPGPWRKVQHIP